MRTPPFLTAPQPILSRENISNFIPASCNPVHGGLHPRMLCYVFDGLALYKVPMPKEMKLPAYLLVMKSERRNPCCEVLMNYWGMN